ncbi:hypothetical protein IRI77_35810 [Paludibaculum fermentans]|uniref:Uncharacterized protein n=2 Tax=Paludibaculum fermentans TaxID=1473598 RepID=A0A7S7SLH6_PALFE|nr:hypothetical protein IRI77_35810 [Paludibaculum fermentans]
MARSGFVPRDDKRRHVLRDAWVGDAVLCLYARELILREGGEVDGAWYTRMTSNQFLGQLGEPSEVEARIGRAYQGGGLAGAFAWMDENLLPLYRRQEAKRMKASGLLPRNPPVKNGLPSK